MSTLAEIQDAVAQLPSDERKALRVWLDSQAEPEMTAQEEQRLLHSLDAAMRDVDAGKGVWMDDVRRRNSDRLQRPRFSAWQSWQSPRRWMNPFLRGICR